MTALTDPISGLKYGWALGEDNWNTGMDSNLVQLGATINISVLDFVASPVVTTNGTRYIVTTGSGDFSGKNNKLAARVAGAWVFYTLPEGCIVYDEDTNKHYKFEGGSYVLVVDLSSYLTSATASSTYQTQAGMSSYLSIANSRYQFVTDANTTYTVPASAVTANGNTVVELSNNSLTSITVNTATATGKTAGDSVTIQITGTYAAQLLVASGVTLNGTLAFSANAKIKTLIYRGSNTWSVLGG